MSTVDVPVALLGYGTVGAAVDRLLSENAADIERSTGHRLRVVRALVRDPDRERTGTAAPGVLNGSATLHVVTHEAPGGALEDALAEVAPLPETKSPPGALPVVSDRGVSGLGWA